MAASAAAFTVLIVRIAGSGAAAATRKVATPGQRSVEEVSAFLQVPPERFVKSLVYVVDGDTPVLAMVRGDHTLFTSEKAIEYLWQRSAPLLKDPPSVHSYRPGSWGPDAVHQLIARDITCLVVEHNLSWIERACSEVFVMALGSTIGHGSMDTLRHDRAVIDAYLGEVAESA